MKRKAYFLIIFTLSILLYHCKYNSDEYNGVIEKYNQIYTNNTKLSLIQSYPNENFDFFSAVERSFTVTELPDYFYILFDKSNNNYYKLSIFRNYQIFGDTIVTYEDNYDEIHSLNGWFKKDNNGHFLHVITEEKLEDRNNKLWSNNYSKYLYNNYYENHFNTVNNMHLSHENLYKLDTILNELNIESNNSEDLLIVKSGIYYVPFPGIRAISLIKIKDILQMIKEHQSEEFYF